MLKEIWNVKGHEPVNPHADQPIECCVHWTALFIYVELNYLTVHVKPLDEGPNLVL